MQAPDIRQLLLGDGDPAELFAHAWGRTWRRWSGSPARFASVFAVDDLSRRGLGDVVEGAAPPLSYKAAFSDARGAGHLFGAPLEMAEDLLAAGMTLSFTELEHTLPGIARLAGEVAAFVGAKGPVTVTCFVSPSDHGFPWHFDYPHVFALQIEGRKQWRLGRKRVEAAPWTMEAHGPRARATFAFAAQLGLAMAPPDEADCDEVTLEPGDVLYMPPGTWHHARARGDRSCHLSLLVRPITFGRVLRAALAEVGLRSESWRTDLQRLDAAALRDALGARLAELQRVVAGMSPEQLARALDVLATSPFARLVLLDRTRDVL